MKQTVVFAFLSARSFISVQYSLLMFALCTADHVCESLMDYLAMLSVKDQFDPGC